MTFVKLSQKMRYFMRSINSHTAQTGPTDQKGLNCPKGFTLIELSIVLVILGLIIGTIAPLFKTLTKKNKLTDGRQLVATARDEIKGDVVRTRTLPANLSNVGHTIDPWQNDLVYIPANNLAGQDICSWLATGSNQTGLAVCLDGNCAANKKANVAFVVASIGGNTNRQLENPTNHDGNGSDLELRLYNYGTETDQYTTAPDPNTPTDQFDDIIQYVTVDELVQLFNCTIVVNNQSSHTVCSGGAAILDGVDISTLEFNQLLSIGSTTDNCITIDNSCQITYNNAQTTDIDKNGQVAISSPPPGCTIVDM